MYGSLRYKPGFCEEVDKFLEAVEKHAKKLTQNKNSIICPCSDCKNHLACKDVTILRSHLIMRGFVKDYTMWIHRGETVVDDVDPEEDDDKTLDYLDQYVAVLDAQMVHDDHEQVAILVVGMIMTKVVPIMMAEDVLGMNMMIIIWRKCFEPLNQRFY
jgi:hypothetical protein